MRTMFRAAGVVLVLGVAASATIAQPEAGEKPAGSPQPPRPTIFMEGLAIEGVSVGGRAAFVPDAVIDAMISGKLAGVKAGDTLAAPDGAMRTWKAVKASGQGVFQPAEMRRGYLLCRVESERDRVAILDAAGHTVVYVDGEARAGDPYGTGYVRLPVKLKKGTTEFLFAAAGRGTLTARLVDAPGFGGPLYLAPGDDTLPDVLFVGGQEEWAGIPVMNASERPVKAIVETKDGDAEARRSEPATVMPYSVRKVAVPIKFDVDSSGQPRKVALRVFVQGQEKASDTGEVTLRVRDPHTQTHKRTFRSGIDGSVQYYAVRPALGRRPVSRSERPESLGVILSLHGASVEATNQAEAYAPKTWADVVCPTNRRPFGFDWEDWGRRDAYEVLEDWGRGSREAGPFDPERVYLTGHSMGGHGAWHLGVLDPGRWAAVAPSAGWASFATYTGGGGTGGLGERFGPVFKDAWGASDTMALVENLAGTGVYILHGDKDDNVPPSEMKRMAEALEKFHRDWRMHSEPGAGHWWDQGAYGPEDGAACVDWPPMMDFFQSRRRSPQNHVKFVTASPGASATRGIATVLRPVEQGKPCGFELTVLPTAKSVRLKTTNAAAIRLDISQWPAGTDVAVEVDGDRVEVKRDAGEHAVVTVVRKGDGWSISADDGSLKRPERFGPFKAAFERRFVLVYGTGGSEAERAWTLNKARFDGETWWYRANGSADVMSDEEFLAANVPADRNVIVYGNATVNKAWAAVLGNGGGVSVGPGAVRVGGNEWKGDGLACLVVRPREGSGGALAAGVGGSGLAGMRLTERIAYLASGVAYPDVVVCDAGVLRKPAEGLKAAGWFGNSWTLEGGRMVIAE